MSTSFATRGFARSRGFLSYWRLFGAAFPGCSLFLCRWLFRQIGWRQLSRRLPQPFQVIKLARALREYVQDEVNIVQKHPLGLGVTFHAIRTLARFGHIFLHIVGDCLYLARVGAGADDKIVGKRSAALVHFKDDDILTLF